MKQQISVFLINLRHSRKRLQKMTARLSNRGLEYRLIEAVDGSELSTLQLGHLNDQSGMDIRQSYGMSASEIGCFLSHFEIYRIMKEENIEQATIIEDDCIPHNELEKILDNLDKIKPSWHVIHLVPSTITALKPNKFHTQRISDDYFLSMSMTTVYGTSLYLIQRNYAVELLNAISKLFLPIDTMLFELPYPVRLPYMIYRDSNGKMLQDAGSVDPAESSTVGKTDRSRRMQRFHILKRRKIKIFSFRIFLKPIKKVSNIFLYLIYNSPQKDRINGYFPDYKSLSSLKRVTAVIKNIDWIIIKKVLYNKFLKTKHK